MATGIRLGLKRVILALLIVAAILAVGSLILAVIVRLSMILVQVLALPLILLVLVWFVYSLWGRPYFRVWRRNRARNARYLKEAVERGKEGN